MKSKSVKVKFLIIVLCCLFFILLYFLSLEIIQRKLNELGKKAKNKEYHKFTILDKTFLKICFHTIIIGGYILGLKGAVKVFKHYLSGEGKELIIEPIYFRKSQVTKEILTKHYKNLRISQGKTKITKIKINPTNYWFKDINLYYMMNPYTFTIKDSLGENLLFSRYEINSFICFYPGTKTYFPLPGKIIVFPGDIGVALEPLGMGKPFKLKSIWYDTIPWNMSR